MTRHCDADRFRFARPLPPPPPALRFFPMTMANPFGSPLVRLRRGCRVGAVALGIRMILILLVAGPGAIAAGADIPTIRDVESRITAVQDDPDIDARTRALTIATYREAADFLRRADESTLRSQEFRRLAAEAPDLLVQIRAELASPRRDPSPDPPADASLAELEQLLARAVVEVQTARLRIDELAVESQHRAERRTTLPQRIAALRQQLDETQSSLLDPSGEEPLAAVQFLHQSRSIFLRSEIERLEQELAADEARRELLPARRDRAMRRLSEAERHAEAWQEVVSQRRLFEAQRARRTVERMRRDAAQHHPLIVALADKVADLVAERTESEGVTEHIDRAERRLQVARSEIRRLLDDARAVERRLSVSGVNEATGLLLIRHSRMLPSAVTLRRSLRDLRHAIARTEYRLIVLDDERTAAGDAESRQRTLTGC